jgi:rubredoxin
MEKTCSTCKLIKSVELFHRAKKSPDGHTYKCKSCVYEYNKEHRKNNKEKISQQMKEYRNRPEVKEKNKKRYKEYYYRPDIYKRYEEYRKNLK